MKRVKQKGDTKVRGGKANLRERVEEETKERKRMR